MTEPSNSREFNGIAAAKPISAAHAFGGCGWNLRKN